MNSQTRWYDKSIGDSIEEFKSQYGAGLTYILLFAIIAGCVMIFAYIINTSRADNHIYVNIGDKVFITHDQDFWTKPDGNGRVKLLAGEATIVAAPANNIFSAATDWIQVQDVAGSIAWVRKSFVQYFKKGDHIYLDHAHIVDMDEGQVTLYEGDAVITDFKTVNGQLYLKLKQTRVDKLIVEGWYQFNMLNK
jgi:hypothetical protein